MTFVAARRFVRRLVMYCQFRPANRGRHVSGGVALGLLVLVCLLTRGEPASALSRDRAFQVNQEAREVIASGWVQAHRFNTDASFDNNLPRYHGIVSVVHTELQVPLFVMHGESDEFYQILLDLAATPGEPFAVDARRNVHGGNPFNDARVTGSVVEITVSWPGSEKWYRLDEVVDDPGGRGFRMRFAGNKRTIQTGCFVCLYSCPGGRVSNERYSFNDYIDGTTHFRAREEFLPPDGSPVSIRFTVTDEPART